MGNEVEASYVVEAGKSQLAVMRVGPPFEALAVEPDVDVGQAVDELEEEGDGVGEADGGGRDHGGWRGGKHSGGLRGKHVTSACNTRCPWGRIACEP